jgi:hypothetical protein
MNQYGAMARDHWRRFRPTSFAEIKDVDSFFSTLGEEVATEIDETTQALIAQQPSTTDYVRNVGQQEAARRQAEERVLSERVLLPAEPGSPLDESDPTENEAATGELSTGWIPLQEDPQHPWWQDQPPIEENSN